MAGARGRHLVGPRDGRLVSGYTGASCGHTCRAASGAFATEAVASETARRADVPILIATSAAARLATRNSVSRVVAADASIRDPFVLRRSHTSEPSRTRTRWSGGSFELRNRA